MSTERPRKSITVCAKEASGLHYLVRCTLQRSLGGKIALSWTVYLSARALQELLLPLPEQAPNGVLLTTGSVAQSPGVPCPRLTPKLSVVFRSLDPKVTCVKKIFITQGKAIMHLTSFGPAFRAFRCTQPLQSNPHEEHARQTMQTHLETVQGNVNDVMLIEALGLLHQTRLVETIKGCKQHQTQQKHTRGLSAVWAISSNLSCSYMSRHLGWFGRQTMDHEKSRH